MTAGKYYGDGKERRRGRAGVDDEEQGRAFIGFDECTVSRRNRRARRWEEESEDATDASWNLTNDGMSRDGRDATRERKKYGRNGELEDVHQSDR